MPSGKRHVVVCGATGFLGRNILERLAKNEEFDVWGVRFGRPIPESPIPNVKFIQADLRNDDHARAVVRGADIVIQAAAVTTGVKDTFDKPYFHVTDNVVMNAYLMRAAHEAGVKHFIFLSCSVMYNQTQTVPQKEDDVDLNKPFYSKYFGGAWTKVFHEKMCEFYARLGKMRCTAIRHSNVYGPYDKFDLLRAHLFGATLRKVMDSKDGKVHVWGDGTEKRDLLYVSDVVDFIESVIDRHGQHFEVFNIGSEECISVKDLVSKVIFHSGRDLQVEFDTTQPSLRGTRLSLDSTKALQMFGWRQKVSLDEGIKMTLDWYKKKKS